MLTILLLTLIAGIVLLSGVVISILSLFGVGLVAILIVVAIDILLVRAICKKLFRPKIKYVYIEKKEETETKKGA